METYQEKQPGIDEKVLTYESFGSIISNFFIDFKTIIDNFINMTVDERIK